jgi:hypothetical protein
LSFEGCRRLFFRGKRCPFFFLAGADTKHTTNARDTNMGDPIPAMNDEANTPSRELFEALLSRP